MSQSLYCQCIDEDELDCGRLAKAFVSEQDCHLVGSGNPRLACTVLCLLPGIHQMVIHASVWTYASK